MKRKRKPPKIKKFQTMKNTEDEWYPCYIDPVTGAEQVEVSFLIYPEGGKTICVWGADDMGLEKEYDDLTVDEVRAIYEQIIAREYVNIGYLKKLGFGSA